MKTLARALVHRLPYIRALTERIRILGEQVVDLHATALHLEKQLAAQLAAQGAFVAGHYYSPIPSSEDVKAYLDTRTQLGGELPGIEMHAQAQRELLLEFASYYSELSLPEQPTPGHRYYNSIWFGYSDAIFLHCFLRKYLPKRIIEVGSGFSSALMLDTIDRHFPARPDITFIEPYPERLKSLLTQEDLRRATLIDKRVQDVPLDSFQQLQAGDLLFIDSSHVLKSGSDLQFLLFEVLPRLQQGVIVHFHDVFHPFDYPDDWLKEGRFWNEVYFLRAFLMGNSEWQVRFFSSYAHLAFAGLIDAKLPLCARSTGGSLYIERV